MKASGERINNSVKGFIQCFFSIFHFFWKRQDVFHLLLYLVKELKNWEWKLILDSYFKLQFKSFKSVIKLSFILMNAWFHFFFSKVNTWVSKAYFSIDFSSSWFNLKKALIRVQPQAFDQSNTFIHTLNSEQFSPVFSNTFAFSGSEVFTINVRPLSVNASINTTQRCTSYASFWLSHLLKERAREKQRRRGRERRDVSTKGIVNGWLPHVKCEITLIELDFIHNKDTTRDMETNTLLQ